MAARARRLSLTQRGLNFEMLMWFFTRLSALAMYALVLFALVGALIMGARNNMSFADVMRWGFMPNVTHVQSTNVPELEPWATPLWKVTACLMLLVAASHGIHGLVVIADDYIVSGRGRQVVRLLSILFLASMSVIGVLLIWNS
jgi:succinate dehydrogenase hydrophobic anchor subunit